MTTPSVSMQGLELAEIIQTLSGANRPRYRAHTPSTTELSNLWEHDPDSAPGRVSETMGQNPHSAEMRRVQDQVGRGQRLFQFLQKLTRSGEVPTETADIAWRMWNQLKAEAAGLLLAPDASGGPNGGLLLFWDQGEHHLELEFLPDGEAEFFYRNRRTGALWGADHRDGHPFTEEILNHAAFFHLP